MGNNVNYRSTYNARNSMPGMPSVKPPSCSQTPDCPQASNNSCEELMRAIMEADFYAQDLKLYLDTHPNDTKAIEMFREAVRQSKACKAAFEDSFYPLTASGAGKNGCWDWLDGNFPPLS